eukprot:PhM_4_TR11400/c0_g1_i1/m.71258
MSGVTRSTLHVEISAATTVPLSLPGAFFDIIDDHATRSELAVEAARVAMQEKFGGYDRLHCSMTSDNKISCVVDMEDYTQRVGHMTQCYDNLMEKVRAAHVALSRTDDNNNNNNVTEALALLRKVIDDDEAVDPIPAPTAELMGECVRDSHHALTNDENGDDDDDTNDGNDDDDGVPSGYVAMADDSDVDQHDQQEGSDLEDKNNNAEEP